MGAGLTKLAARAGAIAALFAALPFAALPPLALPRAACVRRLAAAPRLIRASPRLCCHSR